MHAAEILSCGMQRLTTGQWFTSRVSACGLFATAYVKASATVRQQLRSAFISIIMTSKSTSYKMELGSSATAAGRGDVQRGGSSG